MIPSEQCGKNYSARDHFDDDDISWATGDLSMTTESRPSRNGAAFNSTGLREMAGLLDGSASSRDVDERTAIYLLSLARELLRRDHSAIASMIDYAIVEIETKDDD